MRESFPKQPASLKRMLIWQHNGQRGSARMIQMQLGGMLTSPTVTEYTKQHIRRMLVDVETLQTLLQKRADHIGELTWE